MDVKTIRELAVIMRENNLSRLEVNENGTGITLEAKPTAAPQVTVAADAVVSQQPQAAAEGTHASGTPIKSNLVGTVYLKPDSESPAYVTVGGRVNKGDTLCLIEAMKMFNDIASDKSGVIKEICVESGQSVEYGQTLFIIGEES